MMRLRSFFNWLEAQLAEKPELADMPLLYVDVGSGCQYDGLTINTQKGKDFNGADVETVHIDGT